MNAFISIIRLLWSCLNSPDSLSIGISIDTDRKRVVLVKKQQQGMQPELLYYSESIPWWLHLITPLVVTTECNDVRPYVTSAVCASGEDPDAWIAANEESSIPSGFNSADVLVEHSFANNNVYSVCVTNRDRDAAIEGHKGTLLPIVLLPPFQALAELYFTKFKSDFMLLQCVAGGTVVAHSENGHIKNFVNTWPDSEDIEHNTDGAREYLATVMETFTGGKVIPVVVTGTDFTSCEQLGRFKLIYPPAINNIPAAYHTAYACALYSDTSTMNLTPFDLFQKAKKSIRQYVQSVTWFRRAALVTIISAVALIAINAGIGMYQKSNNQDLELLTQKTSVLNNLVKKRDSLLTQLEKTGVVTARESRLTILLSELQTKIPEGVWADELAIAEQGDSGWTVGIVALSRSTGSIGTLMKNLTETTMLTQLRMVYSEQVKDKGGEKLNKFRVESFVK
jgi:Tfp pilus assembly protein PilN